MAIMAGFGYIKVADIAVFGGRLHISIYFQWLQDPCIGHIKVLDMIETLVVS